MTFINKVADVSNYAFDLEKDLERQHPYSYLTFPGMDKSKAPICVKYFYGICPTGDYCPYRHMKSKRAVVCKHWLRGLCKKGDDCEFRHQFDMTRMPECYFYAVNGECANKDCVFLHVKLTDEGRCPLYDRGFCKSGPNCRLKHVRQVICENYLVGFCPKGKVCSFVHPVFDESRIFKSSRLLAINCHNCGQLGHKAIHCPSAIKVKNSPPKQESLLEFQNIQDNSQGGISLFTNALRILCAATKLQQTSFPNIIY